MGPGGDYTPRHRCCPPSESFAANGNEEFLLVATRDWANPEQQRPKKSLQASDGTMGCVEPALLRTLER